MKYRICIILLLAGSVPTLWAQWFREPKMTYAQKLEIVKHSLAGDTTDLYQLRRVKYPKELPAEIDTLDFQRGTDCPRMRLYQLKGTETDYRRPLLIWMHEGGWMTGSLEECEPFIVSLVQKGRLAVLSVDYALAPEHPFPEGLHDVENAVQYAYSHPETLRIDTSLISVGGQEAGANLALAAAIKMRHKFHSIIAISPVTRLSEDGSPSWYRYGKGFGLDSRMMTLGFQAYLSDSFLMHDPLVSPEDATQSQLEKLEHLLIVSPEYDILEDQGKAFYEQLMGLGVPVERLYLNGARHDYLQNPEAYYEINQTIQNIIQHTTK